MLSLGVEEVRGIALAAQGLLTGAAPAYRATARATPARVAAVGQTLRALGAVQLDTISTLARSHELVAYARLGAVGREAVEAAYWAGGASPGGATSFEYWSHAACVLPIEEWPLFSFRRREFRRRGIRWHEVPTDALAGIRARLRDEGPLTTADLGGGRAGGEWWDWNQQKIGVEWLLDIGEVVCVRRIGWRRVYDLAERAVPQALRADRPGWTDEEGVVGPSDADAIRALLERSLRVVGVGVKADMTDVHRLTGPRTDRALVDAALADLVADGLAVPVEVEGWRGPAYAHRDALAAPPQGASRTTLLSPFDSLVWHRGRTSRVFGFDHTLEAYVPAAKRVHGYFTMPVLHRGRLVARVDPKRVGPVLHARQVTFEAGPRGGVSGTAIHGVGRALREAAAWVGAESVQLGRVLPTSAATPLASLLR